MDLLGEKMKVRNVVVIIVLVLIIMIVSLKIYIFHNQRKQQVAVFMYHDVVEDKSFNNQADTVSLSSFIKQINYLKTNGYKTLTLDEFLCWKKGKCKSILCTRQS